ncbi:type IV toxin-antitoxin system AbiEi family antitoxin [Flavobacterium sp.]|uniref:type IV toxin-antitoxin system AbiEi family antitoxin domain-containing protein n=1 Tax=Flavobacterium sp. TaxID=239 RepID=UPI002622D5F6|nr:type IV toxin-antitoxin system AbiEi family antitoxin [Flavobacterium sp.]MDD3005238.1 type IV toxin-antitoxin system AbiEi family antitoxin [Flavobacterium sp.]
MLFVDNKPIDKLKNFVLDRNSPLINRTFNENVYYLIEEILYLRNTTHCVVDSKQNILVQTGSQTYNYLEEYIDSVRAKGRYAFTLEELKGKLEVTDKAILQNLYRLKLKNKIVQIRKGFYTILPAEYSRYGVIPSNMYLDDMMQSLNRKYYLGLISAAAIHGASHQQSMETFVITEKPALRDIKNKKLKINFLVKNEWNKEDIKQVKTEAGYINVSSPELTALDLLYYVDKLGMNRIITILKELVEVIKPNILAKTAKNYSQTAAVQRLGYLLEYELDNEKLSQVIYSTIADKKGTNIPLMPGKNKKGNTNTKWRIINNIKIESDL